MPRSRLPGTAFLAVLAAVLWLVIPSQRLWAARAAPTWLAQVAADRPAVLAGEQGASATILLLERSVVCEKGGEVLDQVRVAVRILGKNDATAALPPVDYIEGSDKVEGLSAWLVRADGSCFTYGKGDWLDRMTSGQEALYSAFRQKVFMGKVSPQPGEVLGLEVKVRRGNPLGEFVCVTLPRAPLRLLRFRLAAPAGCEVRTTWHGPAPAGGLLPGKPGGPVRAEWSWRDLPAVPVEPDYAAVGSCGGFIAVSGPSGGVRWAPSTWQDLVTQVASFQDGACASTPAVKSAVAAALAKVNAPEFRPRLAALAALAQEVEYVMEYSNIGPGFGYRPRPASEVLASGHGDCKDKATLLRALCGELGLQSWPVLVNAHPGASADPANPSMIQFNHQILAIAVPGDFEAPAVREVPGVGRLLFFDATSRTVPFGQLPWWLQGVSCLVCAPGTRGLVALPGDRSPERHSLRTTLSVTLDGKGGGKGSLRAEATGELGGVWALAQAKESERSRFAHWSGLLTQGMAQASLDSLKSVAARQEERCEVILDFSSPQIGQGAGSSVRLLRGDLCDRVFVPPATSATRETPLIAQPLRHEGTVRFVLPQGWGTSAVPEPVTLTGTHGDYSSTWTREGEVLVFTRSLTCRGGVVSPADYVAYRQFIREVARLDARPVVLRRL